MPIAEVFLGAFFSAMFEKLASPQLLEFAGRLRITARLDELKNMMLGIQDLLHDAENKQIRNGDVKIWLGDLRDWAYDAEDLLDEVAIKALQRHLKNGGKVDTKVPSLGSRLNPSVVLSRFKISSEMDKIYSRLKTLSDRKARLDLETSVYNTGETSVPWQRPPLATAHAFVSGLSGREGVINKIIELLLTGSGSGGAEGSSGSNKLAVIPIVGTDGIGKTTLARHVFNHDSVQEHFDMKAWVCVSGQFDVIQITTGILGEFGTPTVRINELNTLQAILSETLVGKKFLLVLDDFWSNTYSDWDTLRRPFAVAAAGSKVLVTTRHAEVASMMRTVEPHFLEILSDDECWSIFLRHAFEDVNSTPDHTVSVFCKKVLDKCDGLPLVAKALGGLLRNKSTDHWGDILNSEICNIPEGDKYGILPALRLCYYHLPSYLRRCFSYCSVFPKNYEFQEREVVLLWMAEGLISSRGQEQMEDLGSQYFNELLSRSLFQVGSEKTLFIMHDLVNDLARFAAGKSCLKLEDDLEGNNFEKARHLSYLRGRFDGKMRFKIIDVTKSLRAFLPFKPSNVYFGSCLTNFVPLKVIPKLRYLRVLSLKSYEVEEVPEEIGHLMHLRYVDLSRTNITRLPQSTSAICDLQTLKLEDCESLKGLPMDIRKLKSLRHLDCSGCTSLQDMPIEMGKLTNLRSLSKFIVGLERGHEIGELGYLVHLHGSISISKLENVKDSKEAREAHLRRKSGLRKLELRWTGSSADHQLQDSSAALDILAELQPHGNLEILNIDGYNGLTFPNWIADGTVSNVRTLTLENCECCTVLPPLGNLPKLEALNIIKFSSLRVVGEGLYGDEGSFSSAFPSLKRLMFKNLGEWEAWQHPLVSGNFPQLEELHVEGCTKMVFSLPRQLQSLSRLQIEGCKKVVIRNTMELKSLVSVKVLKFKSVEAVECFYGDDDDDNAVTIQLLPMLSELEIGGVDMGEFVYGGEAASRRNHFAGACHEMFNSLTSLTIYRIPKLTLLPAAILRGLRKLRQLNVRDCEKLTSLWEIGGGVLLCNSLCVLKVQLCDKLVSLVGGEENGGGGGDEEEDNMQQQQGLPCGLEELEVGCCPKLVKLPRGLHTLTSLRKLYLQQCRSLGRLELDAGFPPSLERLIISHCSSLTCLTSRGLPLPDSLKHLDISICEKLESVANSWPVDCSLLETINISSCRSLKSLPEGLRRLRSLRVLSIRGCKNLRRELLPNSFAHLTRLEHLKISWPAGMAPIWEAGGMSKSLPANLKSLEIISSFDNNISIMPLDWDLHRLTSLESLSIHGDRMTSIFFQCNDFVTLPPSLTELTFGFSRELEKISSSKAFQNLNSLQSLSIGECPELTSIPEQLLPPTLLELWISGCPLLEKRFAKKSGQYWPNVAFIPSVEIHCSCFHGKR